MTLQKIQGASDSFYLTLGNTQFAVIRNWGYAMDGAIEAQHHKAKKESPQPECAWQNPPVPGTPGEANSTLIAYAFKKFGQPWVLSENPRGCQIVGRILMSIDRDKRKRIPYIQFHPLVQDAYAEALREESPNFI